MPFSVLTVKEAPFSGSRHTPSGGQGGADRVIVTQNVETVAVPHFCNSSRGKKAGVSMGNSRAEMAEAELRVRMITALPGNPRRCGGNWRLSPEVEHDFKTRNLAFTSLVKVSENGRLTN